MLLVSASLPVSAHALEYGASSGFKGFPVIKRVLSERWLGDAMTLDLAIYLGEGGGYYSSSGLTSLLGSYEGSGGSLNSTFSNGEPNVVALVLWHVIFSELAVDLASTCTSNGKHYTRAASVPVRDSLTAALKPICNWPAASARSDETLLGLWLELMSFDAPEEEYEAWRDFFKGPAYAGATYTQVVSAMVLAAYSNPHFLLRK